MSAIQDNMHKTLRIGQIVPSSNLTMEREIARYLQGAAERAGGLLQAAHQRDRQW